MEFKSTAAEARAMADFEAEVGCDVSAGLDWGVDLDRVMALALDRRDFSRGQLSQGDKSIELFLNEQFGSVMSPEEIKEMAASFQIQIEERLADKISR
jgi:hypothetical protein